MVGQGSLRQLKGRDGVIHSLCCFVGESRCLTDHLWPGLEGRQKIEWQNSPHREAKEKTVNGPDSITSSVGLESLSLEAPGSCIWPSCASASPSTKNR